MKNKPTLVILAAGMGSRYGGLKQLDQMGLNGETIMDYSVYDAIKAGFEKVVFVIRQDFKNAFEKRFIKNMSREIEVDYAFQKLSDLPKGFTFPERRTKPWGTNHAVWAARNAVKEPFAVINADDFYGADAFIVMANYLSKVNKDSSKYAMVGYPLANTLSEHGTVNRGICKVDTNNFLQSVDECEGIGLVNDKIQYEENGEKHTIAKNTPVSMNMWGFSPKYFTQVESDFIDFLTQHGNEMKSEFYIPSTITRLIESKKGSVQVLNTTAQWFGVTYQEDKAQTIKKIEQMIANKKYPEKLWN